jgi:hypothetical protein
MKLLQCTWIACQFIAIGIPSISIDPLDVAADQTEVGGDGASDGNASKYKDLNPAFVETDMEKTVLKAETAVLNEGEVPF